MLITKTPLRVSFAGGGTDLESFYKHYNTPGCVVSCSIDKYIYQLIKNNFFDGSIISYSQVEKISNTATEEIARTLVSALALMNLPDAKSVLENWAQTFLQAEDGILD